jgi:regulator of PEP synthase PpsR (kinase-PPPase family)
MNTIFVVSDGTGRTASQALHAALAQFPGAEVEIIVRSKVRTRDRAREVVCEAAKAGDSSSTPSSRMRSARTWSISAGRTTSSPST